MNARIRRRLAALNHRASSPNLIVPALVVAIVVACGALVYTVQSNGSNNEKLQAQAIRAAEDNRAVIDCINGYIAELSKSSKKRTDANTRKDEALTEVIDSAGALVLGSPTPAQLSKAQAALANYTRIARDLAAVRVTTPVPTFNVEFCESLR